MNKRQRGLNFQRWIKEWLMENYPDASVHNQIGVANKIPVRDKKTGELKDIWIAKNMDILGCIDLIAIIPGRKPLFIQATLDSGVGRKLHDLIQVPWPLQFCGVQVWVKREDGLIQIKQFTGSSLEDIGQIVRRKFYRLDKEVGNGESQQHTA